MCILYSGWKSRGVTGIKSKYQAEKRMASLLLDFINNEATELSMTWKLVSYKMNLAIRLKKLFVKLVRIYVFVHMMNKHIEVNCVILLFVLHIRSMMQCL